MNYGDNELKFESEVYKTSDGINEIYKEVQGQMDLESILEDML